MNHCLKIVSFTLKFVEREASRTLPLWHQTYNLILMAFLMKLSHESNLMIQFNPRLLTAGFAQKAIKSLSVLVILMILSVVAFSQESDSLPTVRQLKGAVTVTNNGISVIPTFMLGKPAVMFDLGVSGKRLSFEPQLRFALEGKPWSFIFWWRYKVIREKKFTLNVGVHPAIAFRETQMIVDGESRDMLVAQRFFAEEVVPTFRISEKLSLGLYYLHANGLDKGTTKNTDYLSLNTVFSNIRLVEDISLKLNPQLYLLKMDELHGYYVTSTFTVSKKDFPVTLSSVVNQVIKTDIPSKDLVWNLSLVYAFSKEYVGK
jgi:hypothetical protein